MPYFFFLIGAGVLLLAFPKGWLVLELNALHFPAMDQFFRFATAGGEEWAGITLGVFLLIFRPRKELLAYLVAIAIVVVLVQFLKRWVFSDCYRPVEVLKTSALHVVDGIKLNRKYSFPSGHTSAGFLFFAYWAFILRNAGWKLFFLISAVLVGFSRIYLAQHFLEDVAAGSLIGICFAMWAVWLANRLGAYSEWWNKKWGLY